MNTVGYKKQLFIREIQPKYSRIMPRPKGSQNKVTKEVKDKLQSLIDEVVESIDVDVMTT